MPEISERVIRALQNIVGAEYVHNEPAILVNYSRDIGVTAEGWPDVVVRPETSEEVQQIIRLAQREKIPVTPVSGGKDLGFAGDLALHGGIILDMKRMNRILEINDELGYCVLEPGVTFYQLYSELRDHHPQFALPVIAGPPTASVVANYITGGGALTPVGARTFENLCGLEVVVPTGEAIRTGPGALIGSKTPWGISKYGYGSFIDGLFHLSPNLGIVTKAGVWLIPKWKAFDWFIYGVDTAKEIVTCMKFLQPMVLKGIVGGGFTCANWLGDVSSSDRYPWEVTGGKRSLPEKTQKEFMEKHGIGWWNVYCGVYGGSEKDTDAKLEQIDKFAKTLKGFKPLDKDEVQHKCSEVAHKILAMQGIPIRGECGWVTWREGGLCWDSLTIPMRSEDALNIMEIANPILDKYGFDYSAKHIMGYRGAQQVFFLMFKMPDELQKARQCFTELTVAWLDAGYLPRRIDPWVDPIILSRLGNLTGFLTKIKNAIDPNRILHPSRFSY